MSVKIANFGFKLIFDTMSDLSFIPPFTVGVDLGGTNTAFAVVDSQGNILAKDSIPTHTPTIEAWATNLFTKLSAMITENGLDGKVIGIGVGAPAANAISGCIEGATNLPWSLPVPMVDTLQKITGIPTSITNDANAAAIGEMAYGAAKGLKNFIVLTLGTGIGSGIVVDGHLLTGSSGFAGELGHVRFPFAQDRLCGCGRYGCLETIGSARGVVETAKRMLRSSDEPSQIREIPEAKLTPKDVSMAALNGDKIANEVWQFTGKCLGEASAEFASMADPEAIIIFGGVAKAGELILAPMREAFKANALHLYRDRVRFLQSSLPDADAAILGAAALPYMHN